MTERSTNDSRVGELIAEKAALAEKALNGDAAATKRVAAIDEEIGELTWRAELEELAAKEVRRQAQEKRQHEAAERLADARSRYKEHGESWKRIAAKAQEQVDALRETLDELEEADLEQREAAIEAGERMSYITADLVIANWLQAHLDHIPGVIADLRYSVPLADLAPLPESIDPPTEEQIAEREAAAARSREEAETERRLSEQRTNAEVAAYEVLLPAMVFADSNTEERRTEIYEQVNEVVRRSAPDLPEAMLERVIEDAMKYFASGGAGEDFDAEEVPHRAFGSFVEPGNLNLPLT